MPDRQNSVRLLGKRLRELRVGRGLSQEEVGERSGFTGKYISEIERGRRDPPFTTLTAIATKGIGVGLATVFRDGAGPSVAHETAAPYGTRLPVAIRRLARELMAISPRERRRIVTAIRTLVGSIRKS